ncbi:hypothetical protein GQ53DRAFT_89744 [Thozetella sp. PMI_491]|nr:hypothetical protein GQ53DRAFT_89744 [Thozetella sp. PMI_491]
MAEAEVVRPLAAVGTQPAPNPHVSPRLNGDLARLVTSDLPEPSVDHRPGPVLSSHGPLPPLGSSVDLPPRVVSDVQPGPAAGTVNGIIHAPPHSTVSPGAGPRSGSTSQPASKGSSPHIASRSSTPTVESVQARQAHPINLRWREPQTLQYATPGGPAPGPAHSTHATPSYSQFGSNTQSQYISPPHSGPEATGRGSTPGSGHQPSHARYPGGLQAPPPPPPPPPPPAPAQQFPYQKPPPYLGQSPSKPIIMDPPSVRNRPPPTNGPAAGFASPTRDYARESTKFVDDCTRLNFAVQQSVPEAVRRILRDNWEKCLLGSDFHQAFISTLSLH